MANTIQTAAQPKWLFNFQGPSGTGPGIAGAVRFTPEGLVNGLGQKSDVLDLGTPRTSLFQWRAKAVVAPGTPTVGGTIELFLATSDDNTNWDANLGSGNYGVSVYEKRRNLQYIGSVSVDYPGSGIPFIGSGFCQIYARYASIVWWNFTGQDLSTRQGDSLFQLTPVPDQIQTY